LPSENPNNVDFNSSNHTQIPNIFDTPTNTAYTINTYSTQTENDTIGQQIKNLESQLLTLPDLIQQLKQMHYLPQLVTSLTDENTALKQQIYQQSIDINSNYATINSLNGKIPQLHTTISDLKTENTRLLSGLETQASAINNLNINIARQQDQLDNLLNFKNKALAIFSSLNINTQRAIEKQVIQILHEKNRVEADIIEDEIKD